MLADVLRRELTEDVQSRLVGLGKQAGTELDAVTGYMTFDDRRSGYSPYESLFHLQHGLARAPEVARGYYWGNYLGAEQVRRLGGFDSIHGAAPCHLVEDLSDGRRELAYLQLTPRTCGRSPTTNCAHGAISFSRSCNPEGRIATTTGPPLRVLEEETP